MAMRAGERRSRMKRTAAVFAVVVAAAVGCKREAPAGPAPGAPTAVAPAATPAPAVPPVATGGAADPCPTICDRTRALGCKRASACRDTCREMQRVDGCQAEMTAVLSCFARQPLSAWECSEDGDAAMKDGFCDQPQGRFTACVEGGSHGAAPPAPTQSL